MEQMKARGEQFDLKMEWIDVEYTKGEALAVAIAQLKPTVIWTEMGNTYNLCHHLWNSGGAQIIKQLVSEGAIYIGTSAGSIMAGHTCQMAFWKDWDDRTCQGTVSVDWRDKEVSKGLDLAGGVSILPHAVGMYSLPEWQAQRRKACGHMDLEVVVLEEEQGYVIENGKAQMV